ncbi:Beta-1,4-galactosyltransferase 2 [Triplophysa tibetana]|uniref:Beta-1,4-galactosyltransferase 2 n=1 Tax=Triplophysa tibetana TaxID=1572043 RepID=A0A5A9PC20_9TELE|nr:Beta-1,4-galactosyltransferase 2 [Triplophysa tibetana]
MSRLMLGRTLERICKGVLLLCLVHFLIMMFLYFDVYSQRFDIFSRFNNGRGTNGSRGPHHYNFSRPNTTFASYVASADHLLPSAKPEENQTPSTPKPLPPCPEIPPGLELQGKVGVCGGLHPSWQVQLVAYDDSLPPLCCWDAALQ